MLQCYSSCTCCSVTVVVHDAVLQQLCMLQCYSSCTCCSVTVVVHVAVLQ